MSTQIYESTRETLEKEKTSGDERSDIESQIRILIYL